MAEKFGENTEPTEITKDVVVYMIQSSFERVINLRHNKHITIQDAIYALEECTFIFRRCLIFLYKQGEIELAHALSVMWKSVIMNVDSILTLNQ